MRNELRAAVLCLLALTFSACGMGHSPTSPSSTGTGTTSGTQPQALLTIRVITFATDGSRDVANFAPIQSPSQPGRLQPKLGWVGGGEGCFNIQTYPIDTDFGSSKPLPPPTQVSSAQGSSPLTFASQAYDGAPAWIGIRSCPGTLAPPMMDGSVVVYRMPAS
jgi:hypothetical protein